MDEFDVPFDEEFHGVAENSNGLNPVYNQLMNHR